MTAVLRREERPAAPATRPHVGWVQAEVAHRHPDLALVVVEIVHRPSTRIRAELRHRLELLARGIDGQRALKLHEQEIPHAFRVLYRQLGIDLDVEGTPIEQAHRERIGFGGFRSTGVIGDALKVALVETGVPVWAVDPRSAPGELGIRMPVAADGADGTVPVVAAGPVAIARLGTGPAEPYAPTPRSPALTLYTLQCAGVSSLHVHEALWIAESLLHHR